MASLEIHLPVAAQPSIGTNVEYSQTAEARGYERVWVPESWGRDAVTTLTTISERTSTVGIGTSIVNIYSRSPAVLGQTAATLQEVSNSRFRLGIGPSAAAVVEHWHGVDFEQPLRRLREYVEILDLVLGGEPVDYDGNVFSLGGFKLRGSPPDEQPPIDTAGIGPKAVELAGRFADGWHATMLTPDGLRERLTDLRRGVELGDRAESAVRVTLSIPCCALADAERARSLGRNHLAFYIGGMGTFYRDAVARQGDEQTAIDIHTAWQAGERERATALVDDEMIDSFLATGSPEHARAVIEQFQDVEGLDAIAANFPRGATSAEITETMEHLQPT
jgi:coenzyme F420-dependent oxidoreductase